MEHDMDDSPGFEHDVTDVAQGNGHASAGPRRLLTASAIEAAEDIDITWVSLPMWAPAGTPEEEKHLYGVFVRTLTEREVADWQKSITIGKGQRAHADLRRARLEFNRRVMCNERGEPVFGSGDLHKLEHKSSRAMSIIWHVGAEKCGLSPDALEDAVRD